MKQTFTHYRNGYLQIRLQGFSPERFLNLCVSNQIELWELQHVEGQYQFFITVDGYRRIRPLVKKAQVRLEILGRFGLPFFLHRNQKRKLSAVGMATFFLVLFVMSRFVWNITLEGNFRFTDDTLLHYLNQQDIRYGVRKSTIDCDRLEEALRTNYPEIIWVSARISGTRLMIKVKENEVMASIPTKNQTPRDLVADKDGIITSMIVRRGKAQVAVGEMVTSGQVLVRGAIPIINDAEEIVNYQYVCSDADIRANTTYAYAEQIPYLTTERINTGRARHGLQVRLFRYSALFLLPSDREHPWEFIRESKQVVLLGDFYLPIWLDHIIGNEYGVYERFLTKEELEIEKNKINDIKIQNLQEKGVQIIENNVKILDKKSSWEIRGDYVINELIGVGQDIKNEEKNQKTEEETGAPR